MKFRKIYRDVCEHEKSLLKHIFGGFITCCYHLLCYEASSNEEVLKTQLDINQNRKIPFVQKSYL